MLAGSIDCSCLDEVALFIRKTIYSDFNKSKLYDDLASAIAPMLGVEAPEDSIPDCETLMSVMDIGQEHHWPLLSIIQPLFDRAWNQSLSPVNMIMVAENIFPPREEGVANDEVRLSACDLIDLALQFYDTNETHERLLRAAKLYARGMVDISVMESAREEALSASVYSVYDYSLFASIANVNDGEGMWQAAADARTAALSGGSIGIDRSGSDAIRGRLGTPPLALLLR